MRDGVRDGNHGKLLVIWTWLRANEVIIGMTDFEKKTLHSDDCNSSLGKIPRIHRYVSYLLPSFCPTYNKQEKRTRDKAIKSLSLFLSDSSRDDIPKPDMDKLWKGIFYSLSFLLILIQASQILARLLDVGQAIGSTSPCY